MTVPQPGVKYGSSGDKHEEGRGSAWETVSKDGRGKDKKVAERRKETR